MPMRHGEKSRALQEALEPFPRWRLFGEGTAKGAFEFTEQVYAAGFVTRAIEQARAFDRIPDLSLSGSTVKIAVAVAIGKEGLAERDRRLFAALERAANHPGRPALTEAPILPLLADRWSPRSFSDDPVERAVLERLLEAARWAPSCHNEQPWRYVVITSPERREEAAEVLNPGNAWARQAPVLILVAVSKKFAKSRRTNRTAAYDAGGATAQLLAQATALGLVVHQMAGFDVKKARDVFHVPEKFEPMAMVALGYWGEGRGLSEELLAQEQAPRERLAAAEWLFWEDWGAEAPAAS
jgi:nitroreductase/pterin-4a-carbinolamine dehydratase